MTSGEMESKKCSKCGAEKSIDLFYNDKRSKDGKYSACKSCRSSKTYSPQRESYYRRTYGISLAEYDLLLEAQDGKCSLCGKKCSSGRNLAIDHDHDTGAIRGLLCLSCNKYKVGNLKRDQVAAILNYMDNPPADRVFGSVRMVPDGKKRPKRSRKRRKSK